jgi:outer membrane protein OmpA-like peptidoglycan-associated protein
LPEGYKIIEAQPLQYKEGESTGFNVNRNAEMGNTNVNVEVLKKEFNKEQIDKAVYSELDKFPSSYYAEGDIYYGPGRALLTENVRDILNGVADKLNKEPLSMLRLTAYADADKEAVIGDYIGKLRVEEITKYLMSRNVQFSQLNISVIGNSSLENECYQGKPCSEFEHQQNRKVELIFSK